MSLSTYSSTFLPTNRKIQNQYSSISSISVLPKNKGFGWNEWTARYPKFKFIYSPNNVLFFKKDSTLKTLQIVNNSQNRFALSMSCAHQMFHVHPASEFLEDGGSLTVVVFKKAGMWIDSKLEIVYTPAKDTDSNSERVLMRRRIEKMSHQILLKKSPSMNDPSSGNSDGYTKGTQASHDKKKDPVVKQPRKMTSKKDENDAENLKTAAVNKNRKRGLSASSNVGIGDQETPHPAKKSTDSGTTKSSGQNVQLNEKNDESKQQDAGSGGKPTGHENTTQEKDAGSGGKPKDHEDTPPRIIGFLGVQVEHRGQVFTIGGSLSNESVKGSSMPMPGGQWAGTPDPKVVWCRYCRRNHSRSNKSRHVCRTSAASSLAILGPEPSNPSLPAICEVEED